MGRQIIKSIVSFEDTYKPTISTDNRVLAEVVINKQRGLGYIKAETQVTPKVLVLALLANKEFHKLTDSHRRFTVIEGKDVKYISTGERTVMNGEFVSLERQFVSIISDIDDGGYTDSLGPVSKEELMRLLQYIEPGFEDGNGENENNYKLYRKIAYREIDLQYHKFEEV